MSLTDQLNDLLNSFDGFGPTLWLSIAFCVLLVIELVLHRSGSVTQRRRWLAGFSVIALVVAGVWSIASTARGFLFLHLLFIDNQAIFFQTIVVVAALFVLLYDLVAYPASDRPTGQHPETGRLPGEWYSLLMAMTLGLFLMTVSVNLLSIYLSIELVSICSYLLTALTTTRKASEGGIKYLLFGSVSSAIMLYGMSLLYGITGTLDLTTDDFGLALAQQDTTVAAVALLLTLAGVLFKLAGVPFHAWTPDAYEAAPVPVAAFFSVAPKAAAVLVLMRLVTALPAQADDAAAGIANDSLQIPLAVLALAGILIGNLSALRQTDAKRLLAYSSIAHAGFLLVGVVAFTEAGFQAVIFYASTYLFISLAAFFLIDMLAQTTGSNTLLICQFAGLGSKFPLLSVGLTIVMLALTGLPPTVGFTAKLLSFSALFEAYQRSGNNWLLALFALGLLNALISLVYYLKIPFLLFFRPTVEPEPIAVQTPNQPAIWLVGILVIPIVGLFLRPQWIMELLTGW
ncbi:NADH-quinone oxidoreductase subunit N [Spirosoma sp. SC4-14]|uniref:NADH-quinone oxidoreductase subunit N n=1 Tax=Spirosoma sp. SC4-14 TaxID=3128900 RepID=UPI0030CFD635